MMKCVRNGRIAIIYHPGYGLGWYTFHGIKEALFDPKLVDWITAKQFDEANEYIKTHYELDAHKAEELEIFYLTPGSKFLFTEYDGSETVISSDQIQFIEA